LACFFDDILEREDTTGTVPPADLDLGDVNFKLTIVEQVQGDHDNKNLCELCGGAGFIPCIGSLEPSRNNDTKVTDTDQVFEERTRGCLIL
jgi:hypothetical protein